MNSCFVYRTTLSLPFCLVLMLWILPVSSMADTRIQYTSQKKDCQPPCQWRPRPPKRRQTTHYVQQQLQKEQQQQQQQQQQYDPEQLLERSRYGEMLEALFESFYEEQTNNEKGNKAPNNAKPARAKAGLHHHPRSPQLLPLLPLAVATPGSVNSDANANANANAGTKPQQRPSPGARATATATDPSIKRSKGGSNPNHRPSKKTIKKSRKSRSRSSATPEQRPLAA
mmetsp:Transcript_27837/g.75740  ORF Transcript_27837/g.75740 Transcript_27837/m.75740 type:complete len:227 (-) Transcript_27837:553-1233(-)